MAKRKGEMTRTLTRKAKADVKEIAEGLYGMIHKKIYRYSDSLRGRHNLHGDTTKKIVRLIKQQIIKTIRAN